MLDVRDMGFARRERAILSEIAFGVGPGRMLVILGPNGAGKTTLLKCLNGLLAPRRGAVLIEGEDLRRLSARAVAARMGYVAQRTETARLTVFDAVLMGRKPHMSWQVSAADLALTRAAIARLGLEHLALRHVDELSGGELQKTALARALTQEPRILLLDEPTSALDLRNQVEILSLLRAAVAERRMAGVLTMHDLNMALRFADDFLLLADGRILARGPVAGLTAELVERAYGQRVRIHRLDGAPVVVPLME